MCSFMYKTCKFFQRFLLSLQLNIYKRVPPNIHLKSPEFKYIYIYIYIVLNNMYRTV